MRVKEGRRDGLFLSRGELLLRLFESLNGLGLLGHELLLGRRLVLGDLHEGRTSLLLPLLGSTKLGE